MDLLAASGPDRRRPTRSEAVAIQIPNPPIAVSLGTARLDVDGRSVHADVSARVFDFGVVSMRARIAVDPGLSWSAFADWGTAVHAAPWSDLLVDATDRERAWRDGIDRKIAIVRGTYDMLNAESLARRSETLALIVVLLIMFEIVLSLRHIPR